jgi:molecular chaperone HscB
MAFRPQRIAQHLSRTATPRSLPRPTQSLSNTSQDACLLCRYRQPARGLTTLPTRRTPTNQAFMTHRRSSSTEASKPTEANKITLAGAPDITNHYTIFPQTLPAGPPPGSAFAISTSDLRREFLQLQGLVHPDKYPNGAEKQLAEGLSARINEAYRTLLDPLQRAQYILREWHGIDVTAEDASTKHALDAETLMEVMEVQETIEEVGDSAEAEVQINELKKENEGRVVECVNRLGEAFEKGDLEAARKECIRLRFWYSVGEGLREWEPGNTQIRLMHSS